RYQQRPEAYWTPTEGGFFSPGAKNTPQKVTIQQWIHQSFNVLWVVNGLVFYIMVFATGHWMRLVPTNWDIFPNIVSAGIQYLSLDWPPENAWVYYNALQMMTYFITIFIAAPLAVLTGLRLSTWWPQKAERINKAFSLPVARTIHFVTMVYFVLFIIVHLFLVFTTGVLTNLNMMFTARHVDDWIGIAVFAVSVAVTVAIAWLLKPIFISGIAEQIGQAATRYGTVMILDNYTPIWETEEHADLREMTRDFIATETTPNAERFAENQQVDRDLWNKAGDNGLLLISVPEEYGGGGADFSHEAVIL